MITPQTPTIVSNGPVIWRPLTRIETASPAANTCQAKSPIIATAKTIASFLIMIDSLNQIPSVVTYFRILTSSLERVKKASGVITAPAMTRHF
jgi:hypothetical protein